jgi:hypothetical protein
MRIIVTGNPIDGVKFYGPADDLDDPDVLLHNAEWWVADLHPLSDLDPNLHRFYFTFGRAYNLRDNYVVVKDESRDGARRRVQAIYGRSYAFDYDEATFAPQPDKYGLTEVPLGTPLIQEQPL